MLSIIQHFDEIDNHCHISPSATKLYWKLVAQADIQGQIQESYRSLASRTAMSVNTIRDAAAELITSELLEISVIATKTYFAISYFQSTVSNFDTEQQSVSKFDTLTINQKANIPNFDIVKPENAQAVSNFNTEQQHSVSKNDILTVYQKSTVSNFDTKQQRNISKFDTPYQQTVSKFDTKPAVNNNNNKFNNNIIINPIAENENLDFLSKPDFQTKVAMQLKNPNYASGLIHEFQNKNSQKDYENPFKAEQHFWNWLSKVRENYAYQTKCHNTYQTIATNQAKEKWLQVAEILKSKGFDDSLIRSVRIVNQENNKLIVEVASPNVIEKLEEEPLFLHYSEAFKSCFGKYILLEYTLQKSKKN